MLLREKALRVAIGELGVKENPPGSNWGRMVAQYLAASGIHAPAPWCMAFQCWCYQKAGRPLPYPTASVGNFLTWAAQHGDVVHRPLRGDLVCYRWDADNWPDHVGVVERVLAVRWKDNVFAGWVKTIEGNTASGNDSNGGQVQRRWRWHNRCSYVRIPGNV